MIVIIYNHAELVQTYRKTYDSKIVKKKKGIIIVIVLLSFDLNTYRAAYSIVSVENGICVSIIVTILL